MDVFKSAISTVLPTEDKWKRIGKLLSRSDAFFWSCHLMFDQRTRGCSAESSRPALLIEL